MLVRDMEVPDPAGAPAGWDGGPLGPSAPLVPFRPEPLDPADVVGATVRAWTPSAGTYGMGGPGFVGLDLGDRWLVVTLWGAASWLHLDDRLLDDVAPDDTGVLVGWAIRACAVERRWMAIDLDGDHTLRLAHDPDDRPRLADGRPRVLGADDDLRTAVVLAPTTEIWV
ncbi:MAG TPA: hypothetical protein VF228_15630 [Iamia sp.]